MRSAVENASVFEDRELAGMFWVVLKSCDREVVRAVGSSPQTE